MTTYSHSRISTFEQCPYKYKLQYIDRIKVDVPTTIEAFMGDLVHRTLEKLYADLKFQKVNSKDDLFVYYHSIWDKEYVPEILIAKQEYTAENYRKMGEKFISDYYDHYHPFDDMTIMGLETQDRLTLPDGNQYHVRIDKFGFKDDTYFVADYKTNSRLKTQEEADADRQLAMYSIWVKDKFPDAKKVVLKWYMLAFDKEVISERSEEELQKLQEETVAKIQEIEAATEYPTQTTALCNYCVYKSMCPAFKHAVELEEKTPKEFKDDDGVKLVDKYDELKSQKKTVETEMKQIEEDLISFSEQKELEVVYGSQKKVSVKETEKVVYPKEGFVELLKEKGLYDENSMICASRLTSKILKGEIAQEIIDAVQKETGHKLSISKRKDVEEE